MADALRNFRAEPEIRWRFVAPTRHGCHVRNTVMGRIVLNGVELLAVVAQEMFVFGTGWIPFAYPWLHIVARWADVNARTIAGRQLRQQTLVLLRIRRKVKWHLFDIGQFPEIHAGQRCGLIDSWVAVHPIFAWQCVANSDASRKKPIVFIGVAGLAEAIEVVGEGGAKQALQMDGEMVG